MTLFTSETSNTDRFMQFEADWEDCIEFEDIDLDNLETKEILYQKDGFTLFAPLDFN